MSVVASSDATSLDELLLDPVRATGTHGPGFRAVLEAKGVDVDALKTAAREQPFVLIRDAFSHDGLPDTPTQWLPVPSSNATRAARLAVILVNYVIDMETVSYGSENGGALFVNLVALEGPGIMADRSTEQMKGHTDAATFPFRGTDDPKYPRIAPSPDLVYLAALRNPDQVATVVMPLGCALSKISDEHAQILRDDRFVLSAQRSFDQGTTATFGEKHRLDGTHVLFDSPEGVWVRYTHRQSWVYDEDDTHAVAAKKSFEAACLECAQQVALMPGDLLVVNNRKALHGRVPVGAGLGGTTRWLLRSYGLDTSEVREDQRHPSPRHKLYP